MSTTAPGSDPAVVDRELSAVLGRLDREAAAVTVLRSATARKFNRVTLRVELDDGSVVKARYLESPEAVSELVRLRQLLDGSYSAVLAWDGRTLVEEWIAGVPLDELPADEHVLAQAGGLLGRLHRTKLSESGDVATSAFIESAISHLAGCGAAGMLRDDEVDRLVETLRRLDPERSEQTLSHRDFCAENIVLDHRGSLRVIDNEWLAVAPPGLDLGRTRSRWPMSADRWAAFVNAYRAVRAIDDDALRFWTIVAAAWSVHLRRGGQQDAVELPLELLRASLEDSR